MKTDKDVDKLWHDIKKYEDALKRKQEELTDLIDKLKPKQCNIQDVNYRRELLSDLIDFSNNNAPMIIQNGIKQVIVEFNESLNCS